jgi:hypothetical protein
MNLNPISHYNPIIVPPNQNPRSAAVATTTGMLASSVWGMTQSSAATTGVTISVKAAPRVCMAVKAAWLTSCLFSTYNSALWYINLHIVRIIFTLQATFPSQLLSRNLTYWFIFHLLFNLPWLDTNIAVSLRCVWEKGNYRSRKEMHDGELNELLACWRSIFNYFAQCGVHLWTDWMIF